MTPTDEPPRELPRLGMLSEMTNRAILFEIFTRRKVTRAELSSVTGISKPTISQAVRRLEQAALVQPAGLDGGRRGRVATFYQLADAAGWVFGVQIDQSGLRLRATDLFGAPFYENEYPPTPTRDSARLITLLRRAIRTGILAAADRGPLRAGAISVANPVDPATGRIIAMPDSPFPEGQLPLDDVLTDLTDVALLVDNDVNLAALAERQVGSAQDADSFAYVYLGAGLGMGLYVAGTAVRGAHGLAGEIGELQTGTAAGRTPVRATLARALHDTGFGVDGRPALDVDAAIRALDRPGSSQRDAVTKLAGLIAGAVAATCAIVDPQLVVLGGPIGGHPALLDPIREAVSRSWPGPVRIEGGTAGPWPALAGAAQAALVRGRSGLAGSVG